MYSAFSERSPSAAAAVNAETTSRRSTHSCLSSTLSRSSPRAVMYGLDLGCGGRHRLMGEFPQARQECVTISVARLRRYGRAKGLAMLRSRVDGAPTRRALDLSTHSDRCRID